MQPETAEMNRQVPLEDEKELKDLPFTELHLRVDAWAPAFYAPEQTDEPSPPLCCVPDGFEADLEILRALINKRDSSDDSVFVVSFGQMRLRGTLQRAADQETWVHFRHILPSVPPLTSLGIAPSLLRPLRKWGERNGLIIIGGSFCEGKTTTCFSLARDYLIRFGGIGQSLEHPVEFSFQGKVGAAGYFWQIPIRREEEWGNAFFDLMRVKPYVTVIGEVRESHVARDTIKASMLGNIVMCTAHGKTPSDVLDNITQRAGESSMLGGAGMTGARSSLSDVLVGVVHQTMVRGRPVVRILQTGIGQDDPVRNALRAGGQGWRQTIEAIADEQTAKLTSANSAVV